jgi:hypothetical protein
MANGPIGIATTCPVAVPTGGFLSGDFLVAQVMAAFNDFFLLSTDITPQEAGWTEVAQDSVDDSISVGQRLAVFYRFSTGVEPSSYGFEWTASAGNCVRILTYRGVDTVAPIINTAVRQTGPADTVVALTNSVLTTRANTRILCCFAAAQADSVDTFTGITSDLRVYSQSDFGYQSRMGNSNAGFPNILLTGETMQAGIGASGTKTATLDCTGKATRVVLAHAMGIQPKT